MVICVSRENAIVVLDDVLSELDMNKRQNLLNF